MTDNEIIKALEGCGNWQSDKTCDECPANTYGFGCAHKMAKQALDLINRQKAEIERLREENVKLHILIPKMINTAKSEAIKEVLLTLEAAGETLNTIEVIGNIHDNSELLKGE